MGLSFRKWVRSKRRFRMKASNNGASQLTDDELPQVRESSARVNRRKFLGQAGAAAAAVSGALANPSLAFGQSINSNDDVSLAPPSGNNRRVLQAFQTRGTAAAQEARSPARPHTTNHDEARYPDKSGTSSKG